jgi:hypothetical protein
MLSATFGLFIYSFLHGLILCMEMFTLHVVLTSSPDSILSFLFYNNFGEVKITVFKKCDIAGLYQYANNDVVGRFQLIIYLINILLTTSQNKTNIITKYCFIVLICEVVTDSMKHFFVTRLNNLDTT